MVADMVGTLQRRADEFLKVFPEIPTWQTLALEDNERSTLTRACLYTLARHPQGHLPASSLAAGLPFLGSAQSEPYVRKVLRNSAFLFNLYPGCWQMGEPSAPVFAFLDAPNHSKAESSKRR